MFICLFNVFNVSDGLDWPPASVPAAWASQGEQVEWKTESLENAQLSEIWHRVLRWCQPLRVPRRLSDLWLSPGAVFGGICFQAPPALATWPSMKELHACAFAWNCDQRHEVADSWKINAGSWKGHGGLEAERKEDSDGSWTWASPLLNLTSSNLFVNAAEVSTYEMMSPMTHFPRCSCCEAAARHGNSVQAGSYVLTQPGRKSVH